MWKIHIPHEARSCGEIPTKSGYKVIEAQGCGEIPKESNEYKENRIRRCGFCRKRHKLGYSYCPAYGNRCEFCGRYNHDQRACWLKYPNFCRFQRGKTDWQSLGTKRSLNGDTVPAEDQVKAKEKKAIDELKETRYTSGVENAHQSDKNVKVIDELPQKEESVYALD